MSVQDVLIIPMSARTIDESLVSTFDVYQAAADLILKKYGMRLLTADEGGLAPPCRSAEEMLALAVEAIEQAGYSPGKDFFLGIDVASTHFYEGNKYRLDGQVLDSAGMIQTIAQWLDRYPILSVEDGLAEDDWDELAHSSPHHCRTRADAGRRSSMYEPRPHNVARSKQMPATLYC